MHHWFLTIRIKHEGGEHTTMIIDSLGYEAGKRRVAMIKGKLKKMRLMRKKDKCIVSKTIEQTEVECGIRMAAYMTLIRSIDVKHLRANEIISKVNKYVACERNFTKELAACRRSDIHRMLENEQQLIKKGV